jgi:hypothetical protein
MLVEISLYTDTKRSDFEENIQSVARMYYMTGVKIDGLLSVMEIV